MLFGPSRQPGQGLGLSVCSSPQHVVHLFYSNCLGHAYLPSHLQLPPPARSNRAAHGAQQCGTGFTSNPPMTSNTAANTAGTVWDWTSPWKVESNNANGNVWYDFDQAAFAWQPFHLNPEETIEPPVTVAIYYPLPVAVYGYSISVSSTAFPTGDAHE